MMRDGSCAVSVMTRNSSCKFRCAASASSLASSTSEDVSDVVSVRATYEHNLAVLRVLPVTSHRHLPTDDDLRCARAAVSAVLAVRARDRAGLSQFPELSAYGGLQQQPPSRDAAQRDEARPNARHDVVVPRGGWREGRERRKDDGDRRSPMCAGYSKQRSCASCASWQQIGPHVWCHGLRHSSITAALDVAAKAGVGLDKVRAHSRHAVIGTLVIYPDEHDREGTQRTLADLVARTLTTSKTS